MKRLFLLFTVLAIFVATGCQETPQGDPAFKKEPADMEKLQPVEGEKMQTAPEA
ncbi:MAG: hypothetical protein AAFN77_19780 [Planctomycetota bacterium]